MTDYLAVRKNLACDPYRPAYHYVAPHNFMGDPNGTIFWKGKYHLFYQCNPYAVEDRNMHWGHAVSQDLIHWTDMPVALAPSAGGADELGCWSGQVIDVYGTPTAVYYGHSSGGKAGINIATSDDDLIEWTKHPENPVLPQSTEGMEWRAFDPCAWKESDSWYMLCGGRTDELGDTAFLFKSADFVNWEYMNPLYSGKGFTEEGEDCAVPDFFQLGDKYVLSFASHCKGAQYYIGSYKEHKFTPEIHGRLNFGDFKGLEQGNFIAPITMAVPDGRRLYIAWMTEGTTFKSQQQAGWSGIMSLPRTISISDDGTLAIEPIKELESLRGNVSKIENIEITANKETPLDIGGHCLEIKAIFEPGSADEFGIKVCCSPDGEEQTVISYNVMDKTLTVDPTVASVSEKMIGREQQVAPFELKNSEHLELGIFIDRSVVEVFANGRQSVGKRIYPSLKSSTGISLFARGGSAKLVKLSHWDMTPIWPIS